MGAFAAVAAAVASFSCDDAVAAARALPRAHASSAWAHAAVGRALADAADYAGAAAAFSAARAADPLRPDDAALHSTALWHLRRPVEAAGLAAAALAADRRDARAWAAAGNALSLARDHDGALSAFRRASALSPGDPYAHTLAGHELAAGEDFEGALAAFRVAVRLDPRHYNAW